MIIFEEYKLEECIDKLMDYRGKSPKKSAGIPVISAKVVKNGRILKNIEQQISHKYYSQWMCRGIPSSGDIVLTTEGPLGEVAQLDDTTSKFALGQRVITLRIRKNFNSTYIKYALMSPLLQNRLNMLSTGTTVVGISQKALLTLRIPIPERKYQNFIANVLNDLDLKIDINNRMNETLEKMAQAVFQDWFVDFGPVKRKLEGINDPVAILGGLIPDPIKAQKIAGLFPDQFAEDGLPEGCSMGSISTYAELNPESWSAKKHPNVIQYVDLSNTKFGIIKHIQSYSWYKAPSRAKRILIKGDTVIGTVRPDNGAYSLIHTSGLTASTGFAVLRPKEYDFRSFIYCAITRADNIAHLAFLADGGAYPAVTPEQVLDTQVSILHRSILDCFNNIANNLFDLYAHNTDQNHTLAEMRDLLLPKLMSGEISVDELEKKMGGVL